MYGKNIINRNRPQAESPPRKSKSTKDSFKFAGEGILHCFRTQRHMQFHIVVTVVVFIAAILVNLSLYDMALLMFAIGLVIIAEMVNTAIEAVVDIITQTYHPLAKLAKDVAAGAVLVSSMLASIVGVMVFAGSYRLMEIRYRISNYSPDISTVVIVGMLILVMTVIMTKVISKKGEPMRGGVVSGHSAIGFFLAMTIIFTSNNTLVGVLAILMALLLAQSRVDAGVHSIQEVVLGAAIAIILTASFYYFLPNAHKLQLPPIHKPGAAHAAIIKGMTTHAQARIGE